MLLTFFLLSGSYGRPPRQPQQAAPAPISPADPWQVGSPANMASIKDLQVIVEFHSLEKDQGYDPFHVQPDPQLALKPETLHNEAKVILIDQESERIPFRPSSFVQ